MRPKYIWQFRPPHLTIRLSSRLPSVLFLPSVVGVSGSSRRQSHSLLSLGIPHILSMGNHAMDIEPRRFAESGFLSQSCRKFCPCRPPWPAFFSSQGLSPRLAPRIRFCNITSFLMGRSQPSPYENSRWLGDDFERRQHPFQAAPCLTPHTIWPNSHWDPHTPLRLTRRGIFPMRICDTPDGQTNLYKHPMEDFAMIPPLTVRKWRFVFLALCPHTVPPSWKSMMDHPPPRVWPTLYLLFPFAHGPPARSKR